MASWSSASGEGTLGTQSAQSRASGQSSALHITNPDADIIAVSHH